MKLFNPKTVVNCKTKEEFKQILYYHVQQNHLWSDFSHPLDNGFNDWDTHKEKTCVNLSNLFFISHIDLIKFYDYKIINFEELINEKN